MGSKDLPLADPLAVPDTFVSGLANVEDAGDGLVRVTYFSLKRHPTDGVMERVVVARLVRSAESVRNDILTAHAALASMDRKGNPRLTTH